MIVRVIRVFVKPEFIDQFEAATRANHEASLGERGVLRFDVLRHPENRGEYLLYEVYADHAATETHKQTPHYAVWKEAVAEMMARPRESESFEVIAPTGRSEWKVNEA